jgi:hypothetical protein
MGNRPGVSDISKEKYFEGVGTVVLQQSEARQIADRQPQGDKGEGTAV